ncbi:hypothetical protein OC835_000348 [Tilletia horrida]|uniref:Uncharacterized protein n=1 Tax=Tilletia horrida TaxID=155126 RepID=A0AAN6GE53_9BASI|nr:hypothetical protein OC842_001945 [Tilletia horrida]KAK0541028.1 hypothetical protein OC835_000348 [Tilletia horrida]KAK0554858.1 hypothetical protein OC844_006120 [Tilletia horrida]
MRSTQVFLPALLLLLPSVCLAVPATGANGAADGTTKLSFKVKKPSSLTALAGYVDTHLKGNLAELPSVDSGVAHKWTSDSIGGSYFTNTPGWDSVSSGSWELGKANLSGTFELHGATNSWWAASGTLSKADGTGDILITGRNPISCVPRTDDKTQWTCSTAGPQSS